MDNSEKDFVTVGLSVRWLIRLIDIAVLFIFFFVLIVVSVRDSQQAGLYVGIFYVVSLFYFIILKHSRFGTLGNILTKTKVVNFHGEPASYVQHILRLLPWLFFPVTLFADLLWYEKNKNSQTFSDRISSTIVVKKSETRYPEILIESKLEMFMGYCFEFEEIKQL